MGHIVLTVIGMVAQMERRFIKERQREGIERAKADGRYLRGRCRIDRAAVLARKAIGESVATIATALGWSRMQVYRVLAGRRLAPILVVPCSLCSAQKRRPGGNVEARVTPITMP